MQSTKWELYEYQRSRSFIDLGPNHSDSIFLNFISSITADFNVSSALRWVIQDQWSAGFLLYRQLLWENLWRKVISNSNETPHDKTNKMICAPSKNSDQPGHPPSLIRVFTKRSMGSWGPSVSSCWPPSIWSDWVDAQADLSLHLAQRFCWFCHAASQIFLIGLLFSWWSLNNFYLLLMFRYLNQFKEIFTEEGRRAVKITTQRPGQPPIVTCTQATPPGVRYEPPSSTPGPSKQSHTATTVVSSQVGMVICLPINPKWELKPQLHRQCDRNANSLR